LPESYTSYFVVGTKRRKKEKKLFFYILMSDEWWSALDVISLSKLILMGTQ
jgi:hypothetical protein